MSRSREDQALTAEFAEDYRLAQSDIMRELERAACGCDYGGTSWATRSEAQRLARLLGLGPGRRLLEVGAGSGWPGLYLAHTTGCDAALVDLPLDGLRIAAERLAIDRPAGTCWIALADGAALPFKNACFDAVNHSDVLCCLEPKLAVLSECRRVLRSAGKMVFTVLSIAPGISRTDYRRAVESGPPYVEAPAPYPELLARAGWDISQHLDLTAEYAQTVERLLREEQARAQQLSDLLGATQLAERLTRRRTTLGVIEGGLLRRELFAASAPAA